jgi:putative serine protease PepD
MTDPPPSDSIPAPKSRRLLWVVVAALSVVIVVGGVVGGVVLARVHRRPDVTKVACVATTVANDRLPSVVRIDVHAGNAIGTGSGEVIRSDGYILTNNHVISAAADGGSISVLFHDGETSPARLVGRDIATDVAVLKVDMPSPLPTIPWGSSSRLRAGQPVVALGAPLGLASTVTSGIVSALDRSVNVPADNGRTALLVAAIQTDAAINPGNSGGALVDCAGRLVGVPTAGAAVPNPQGGTSAGNIGIGFAIPADFARALSEELITHGSVAHASFGLRVETISETGSRQGGSPAGLFVVATTPDGPSERAGVRAGDVITALEGETATSAQQLLALTLTRRPGDVVKVIVERAGRSHTFEVTLGSESSSG